MPNIGSLRRIRQQAIAPLRTNTEDSTNAQNQPRTVPHPSKWSRLPDALRAGLIAAISAYGQTLQTPSKLLEHWGYTDELMRELSASDKEWVEDMTLFKLPIAFVVLCTAIDSAAHVVQSRCAYMSRQYPKSPAISGLLAIAGSSNANGRNQFFSELPGFRLSYRLTTDLLPRLCAIGFLGQDAKSASTESYICFVTLASMLGSLLNDHLYSGTGLVQKPKAYEPSAQILLRLKEAGIASILTMIYEKYMPQMGIEAGTSQESQETNHTSISPSMMAIMFVVGVEIFKILGNSVMRAYLPFENVRQAMPPEGVAEQTTDFVRHLHRRANRPDIDRVARDLTPFNPTQASGHTDTDDEASEVHSKSKPKIKTRGMPDLSKAQQTPAKQQEQTVAVTQQENQASEEIEPYPIGATKGWKVKQTLNQHGWRLTSQTGSHRKYEKNGKALVCSFEDGDEIHARTLRTVYQQFQIPFAEPAKNAKEKKSA